MTIENALASIAVKDLDASVDWYSKLLERAPHRPMPEVAEWQFERGGGLQVYRLAERAGACSCTLAVSNLEAHARQLQALGVDTSERTSNDRVSTIMIVDLDGNHIALAEARDPSLAR